MTKEKIILIGGGGHCKSCIDVIEQNNNYIITGIIDVKEKLGQQILGYPIIGTDDDIPTFKDKEDGFLITLGQIKTAQVRKQLFDKLKSQDCKILTIIAPSAIVSKHAKIGEGTIILNHAIVNADAVIGSNCIINSKALIEHDVIVGSHCHVSTGAILNGGAQLGDESFYGSGAVCREGAIMPIKSFIKANSIQK